MNTLHTISYAQNREDLLLSGFFDKGEKGFYVDIGAEAPTDLSVTKLFYDMGWNGINIEPIKKQYELFVNERPRDINLNIGISDKKGKLSFREYEGTGYSTFSGAMKKEHTEDDEQFVKQYKDYEVPVLSLKELFVAQKVHLIQFLKIDVEGLEYEVLRGNDWSRYRPEVICIEANHVQKDWRKLLRENNYSLVFFDGLNEYYTDNTTNRAAHFDYIKAIIYKEPIIHFSLLPEIEDDRAKVRALHEKIDVLTAELEIAEIQLHSAHTQINEIMPLRRHVLKSTKAKLKGVDHKINTRLQHDSSFTPLGVDVTTISLEAVSKGDVENLASYTATRKNSLLLPTYNHVKRQSHRAARKMISKLGGKI